MIARPLIGASLLALATNVSAPLRAEEKRADAPWTLQEAIGNPADLTVSGSVRLRYEALHNQFRPLLKRDDALFEAQTAIAAEWKSGPLRIGGELVDARAYGSDATGSISTSEVNTFELLQAYVGADLGAVAGKGSDARVDIGRFVLDLGSRRLVARSNFANSPNGFAGVRFALKTRGKEALTLFYTYPSQKLPRDKSALLNNETQWDRNAGDLIFWGGLFTKSGVLAKTGMEAYFFALDESDRPGQATRDRKLYTPGARIFRASSPGKVDYELEYAYQFGSISSGTSTTATRLPVSAHYLHAGLAYQFDSAWKPRLSLEYDLATGDHRGKAYTRFDGLFGSRRGDYGPTGLFGPLGRSNLSSPGVRLEVTPSKRLDAMASWRLAWLDSARDSFVSTGVSDPAGRSGKFGGQQIEARVRYWLVPKAVRFELGGAAFLRGQFLKRAPAASDWGDAVYGFGDLTLSF